MHTPPGTPQKTTPALENSVAASTTDNTVQGNVTTIKADCYEFLVGRYVKPEDGFSQRLRKSSSVMVGIPVAMIAFAYTVQPVFEWNGSFRSYFVIFLMLICTCMCVGQYIALRVRGYVSDAHAGVMVWAMFVGLFQAYFASPEYENKTTIVLLASAGVLLQMPRLPLLFGSSILLCLFGDWNRIHSRQIGCEPDTDKMFVIDGIAWLQRDRTELFIYSSVGTLLGLMYIFVNKHIFVKYVEEVERLTSETERMACAQEAANLMTVEILKSQKKYDTESVASILEECKVAGVVDQELLSLFATMNENLERYRPFLPNYLFLGLGTDDDCAVDEILSRSAPVEPPLGGECTPASSPEAGISGPSEEYPPGQPKTRKAESPKPMLGGDLRAYVVAPPVVQGYRGVICQACAEISSNEWFSTRFTRAPFSERTLLQQRNTLSLFTETLFDLAQSAKASVHSLVGDAVQLTWNATHRVALPELKAALFLLRLKQALATALPTLQLAGACCAGHAEVHTTISSSTRQQAMYVDAPWLPALDACYTLAKKFKTLVVDANIEVKSHQQVILQGVDCIRYVPKVAVVPETGDPALFLHPGILRGGAFEPKCFQRSPPDHFDTLLGLNGGKQEEEGSISPSIGKGPQPNQKEGSLESKKPLRYTLAFELMKRKCEGNHEEDNWIYGEGEGGGGAAPDSGGNTIEHSERVLTSALMMCVDGQLEQAVNLVTQSDLRRLTALGSDSSGAKGPTIRTGLGRRLIEYLGRRQKLEDKQKKKDQQQQQQQQQRAFGPTGGSGGPKMAGGGGGSRGQMPPFAGMQGQPGMGGPGGPQRAMQGGQPNMIAMQTAGIQRGTNPVGPGMPPGAGGPGMGQPGGMMNQPRVMILPQPKSAPMQSMAQAQAQPAQPAMHNVVASGPTQHGPNDLLSPDRQFHLPAELGFQEILQDTCLLTTPVPAPVPTPVQPMAQAQPAQAHQQTLSPLLSMPAEQHKKNVLGERLYAYICKSHPAEAAKITGMLLEMDNAVLHALLDAPAQLDEKVNEALDVLRHS